MNKCKNNQKKWGWLTFFALFGISLTIGAVISMVNPGFAAPPPSPLKQEGTYAGSSACGNCHKDIHPEWTSTRHAQAFSSPIFQRDWSELSKQTSCLQCHTTGFNAQSGAYSEEGVSCEACHGPFQPNHPAQPMPIKPDADLCSTCHKSTTDEWHASKHSAAGVQCQACHNPHSQNSQSRFNHRSVHKLSQRARRFLYSQHARQCWSRM